MIIQFIKSQYDNKMKQFDSSSCNIVERMIEKPQIIDDKTKIPQWKFCTVNGERRCNDNMNTTNVLMLDFDDKDYTISEFECAYKEYKFYLHTSYSHTDEHNKFRVILFLNNTYEINKLFYKCYDKKYSPYFIISNMFPKADPTSFVKSQFFKVPAIKENGNYYYKFNDGNLFSFDDFKSGFRFAYQLCESKQEEYLRKVESEAHKSRGYRDLNKAREFIEQTLSNTPEGKRHNVVFSLACWFKKKCFGTYQEFRTISPVWSDNAYMKQIDKLGLEWSRL